MGIHLDAPAPSEQRVCASQVKNDLISCSWLNLLRVWSLLKTRGDSQCGGPAMQGKTKCKFHGGLSTGPVTELRRQICAAAKTVHGKDTRADRQEHRLAMKRLRLYAQILGVPFRSDAGDKRL
jgi:hypothetical protein